jgi:hypothetical protein
MYSKTQIPHRLVFVSVVGAKYSMIITHCRGAFFTLINIIHHMRWITHNERIISRKWAGTVTSWVKSIHTITNIWKDLRTIEMTYLRRQNLFIILGVTAGVLITLPFRRLLYVVLISLPQSLKFRKFREFTITWRQMISFFWDFFFWLYSNFQKFSNLICCTFYALTNKILIFQKVGSSGWYDARETIAPGILICWLPIKEIKNKYII